MLGRRGLIADYAAALRGTMAVRRARGAMRLELVFAGAAAAVALLGMYAVFVQGDEASSADVERAALELGLDDRFADTGRLSVVDGDGFVVSDADGDGAPDAGGPSTGGPGGTGTGSGDADGAAAPGTTGTGQAPGTGVLPSEGAAGEGSPGGGSGSGGGHAGGGSVTSLPPTSGEPGTSTSSSTTTSVPGQPPTSPTTEPPADPGLVQAILDLLGL